MILQGLFLELSKVYVWWYLDPETERFMDFNNRIPKSELFYANFSFVHHFEKCRKSIRIKIVKTFYASIFYLIHFYTLHHRALTFYMVNIDYGTIKF